MFFDFFVAIFSIVVLQFFIEKAQLMDQENRDDVVGNATYMLVCYL